MKRDKTEVSCSIRVITSVAELTNLEGETLRQADLANLAVGGGDAVVCWRERSKKKKKKKNVVKECCLVEERDILEFRR